MPAGQDPPWISAAMRLAGSLARSRATFKSLFPRCDHAGAWQRSLEMDYTKPADVVAALIDASIKKLALAPRDLLIRGALSGALLGAATTLALTGAITTGQPIVGA